MELVQHMYISEGLDGRHIDVIASNEADGKRESNQLDVPLMISNGSMLLERSKSNLMVTLVKNQDLNNPMKFSLQV